MLTTLQHCKFNLEFPEMHNQNITSCVWMSVSWKSVIMDRRIPFDNARFKTGGKMYIKWVKNSWYFWISKTCIVICWPSTQPARYNPSVSDGLLNLHLVFIRQWHNNGHTCCQGISHALPKNVILRYWCHMLSEVSEVLKWFWDGEWGPHLVFRCKHWYVTTKVSDW